MMGTTIYTWATSHNGFVPIPTTTTTTGFIGTVPIMGQTTGTAFLPANFVCKIEIGVNAGGWMTSHKWEGNAGGCRGYARALDPKH
jgi:hypothetical protein